jgi:hypothetical protein
MAFLTEAANRGSISTGYDIDNSLKFEPDNSEYLKSNNTHAYTSPTSNQKGTVSFWIKRTEIGNNVSGKQMYIFASANSARYSNLGFDEFDNLTVYSGDSSWNSVSPYTYNKFRDTSAWYHIVLRYDSTDSTASNRLRVYTNGTEVSWVVAPNITQNGVMTYGALSGPTWHSWGTIYAYFTPEKFFAGYLAEAHFVDGQSLAPTEFAEYDANGIWVPKEYDGTYGNAGYYLDFADSGNLGDDESGNGFDFDENNIAAADQATDTPTNNFATLNVLHKNSGSGGTSNNSIFTEGNTKITGNLSGYWQSGVSTIGITSGKWYFEAKAYDSNTHICTVGYGDEADIANWGKNNDFPGASGSKSYGYAGGTASGYGQIIPSTNQPSPAVTYNQTNIIGVAIDADNGYVYWSKDGTYINSGNPASGSSGTGGIAVPTGTGTNGTLFPAVGFYYHTTIPAMIVNFGGYTQFTISSAATYANGYGTFEYAPPSGYYALCTKNLAEYG